MTEQIPDELKAIGKYAGKEASKQTGLIILAAIAALVVGSILWAKFLHDDPQTRCISPAEVQMLCYDNGIDMKSCRVRKPYVVKRAS